MGTAVSGFPRRILRLEALAVLVASVVAYRTLGGSWGLFLALFLIPDLGLVGYLAGPRAGAATYNALHTYLGPAALAAAAYLGVVPPLWPLCLVWCAHIGLDRALGLGLRFASSFQDTHLGRAGRPAADRASQAPLVKATRA